MTLILYFISNSESHKDHVTVVVMLLKFRFFQYLIKITV